MTPAPTYITIRLHRGPNTLHAFHGPAQTHSQLLPLKHYFGIFSSSVSVTGTQRGIRYLVCLTRVHPLPHAIGPSLLSSHLYLQNSKHNNSGRARSLQGHVCTRFVYCTNLGKL